MKYLLVYNNQSKNLHEDFHTIVYDYYAPWSVVGGICTQNTFRNKDKIIIQIE